MQWLVFRNDGLYTAEGYSTRAAKAGAEGRALGEGEFWDRFDPQRPLQRRKVFVIKCLREASRGSHLPQPFLPPLKRASC